MKKRLQSNIWKYALFLVANKRIFAAVLGVYFLTVPGVAPKEIGIILLAGNLAGFIFEIPSGYLSDKIGHKKALVFSRITMLTSTILFLIASDMLFLIMAGVFMSISQSFHSGTGSAFMHETLRGLKREKDYAKVMGKIGSLGFAIPIALTAAVPFLVGISFKAPFLAALLFDFVGLWAAMSLMTPPVKQKEIEEVRTTNFKQVMKEGYKLNFVPFALFSGVIMGVLFAAGGFRAPYQAFLEIPVIWYGVFHGTGRLIASILLAYSGKIKEGTTLFSFLGFRMIFFVVSVLVLGFISDWRIIIIVFIIVNAVQWGFSRVDNSYLVDIIKTSKFKATLLSVHSQVNQVVAGVFVFVGGIIIERYSYQFGYLCLGMALFLMLFPLYIYIVTKHRDLNVAIKT